MDVSITFETTGRDVYVQKILQKKATNNGTTIELMVADWIDSWAEAQFRAYYLDKVKAMTLLEMKNTLGDIV